MFKGLHIAAVYLILKEYDAAVSSQNQIVQQRIKRILRNLRKGYKNA